MDETQKLAKLESSFRALRLVVLALSKSLPDEIRAKARASIAHTMESPNFAEAGIRDESFELELRRMVDTFL